ncbi:MAG: zinc-ribbon domain-containing protein [Candidatus Helarchaeota archaeon]
MTKRIQFQDSRRTIPIQNKRINNRAFQEYTYIGRCRCGYGPNAYYQNSNGKVVPAAQLFKTKTFNQRNTTILNTPQRSTAQKIEIQRICDKCGALVRDDAYFCTECGNALGAPSSYTKKDQITKLKNQIKELKERIKILKKKNP